jgi:3-isopropylmalate dehydrogenase
MSGVHKKIVVLAGDGIGPEVTSAATQVLEDCAEAFGHRFELQPHAFGGIAIDTFGAPLPEKTLAACRAADATLLGAVGGPQWEDLPLDQRPEAGLLGLRRGLGLFINLRPLRLRESLRTISPLRLDRIVNCDLEIVRELAGDIYFGRHETVVESGTEVARDQAVYSVPEVERVAKYALERAAARRGRLTSVDKANILATSVLWRKTVIRLAANYPTVTLDHQYVDNASMQLVLRPEQFDVMVTSNMFGDILSDEAAALAGSIGLIPSMSMGGTAKGALYEPIHGSAPTLAGKDAANPLGTIFSVCMMLRESFGLRAEADWIERGVDRVLLRGFRTPDIAEDPKQVVPSSVFLDQIRKELSDNLRPTEQHGWGV